MNDDADVLIIGAGAAGLAAARELSVSGLKVIVLEARSRIGGRIDTHFDHFPIELGAEFVHGKPPETLKIVERGKLKLHEVPNRHWFLENGVLTKSGEFWSKVEKVMEKMGHYTGPDQSFAQFLNDYKQKTQIEDIESMATLYVEGFHAADADRISVHGLNKTNEAAERIDDDKQFRIQYGYGLLTRTLHDEAIAVGASFQFHTAVEEVIWTRNEVKVLTNGRREYKARRVLVTLPLSLLQTGAVRFSPALDDKQDAARKLTMGHVVKVVLRFREPFWEDLAFIHAPSESLPTWWTQFPAELPVLAGWAGGPRAERLSRESDDSLLDQSLQTLSHIFQTPKRSVQGLLKAFHTHNWQSDPLAAGAYSYIPVGGNEAQTELAKPMEDTLFFAGEATNTDGHQGTVHGAIASGLRAAREIQPQIKSA